MKVEKKLIVYSLVAVVIGAASIVPMLFLMSGTAKAENAFDKPWFNMQIPYAYWTASATEDADGNVTYSLRYLIGCEATQTAEALNQTADARIEYFQLQIYTDDAQIENQTYFVGTNRTNVGSMANVSFHFMRQNWFDTATSGGGQFGGEFTGTEMGAMSGTNAGVCPIANYSNSPLSEKIRNIENADVIYIDVRRLGTVTLNGNSTVAELANDEIIQHIELKKYGDGFLYNTIIPEDQLPQKDLLRPPSWPQQP